jgi:hypothetical protein
MSAKEVYAIIDNQNGKASLYVNGEAYEDLRKLLNRALNCADQAPAWLFKFANDMDKNPVPEPRQREVYSMSMHMVDHPIAKIDRKKVPI